MLLSIIMWWLQAKTEDVVSADASTVNSWGDDDPSVFVMTIAGMMEGDFQLTNGFGPTKAPQVMKVRLQNIKSNN